MHDHEIELSVGETFCLGDYVVTVMEIDGNEVHLKVVEREGEMLAGVHRDFVLTLPR
ncbi:MAG: hypothetical protein R3C01_08215 [Planctomycetaceae bacterium]